jgi:hypothetical protein
MMWRNLAGKSANGFDRMILDRAVTKIGHDVGLVHNGSDDGVGRAGIEHPGLQGLGGHGGGQPLGADLQLKTRLRAVARRGSSLTWIRLCGRPGGRRGHRWRSRGRASCMALYQHRFDRVAGRADQVEGGRQQ